MAKFDLGQEIQLRLQVNLGGSWVTSPTVTLSPGTRGVIEETQAGMPTRYVVRFEGYERGVSVEEGYLEAV